MKQKWIDAFMDTAERFAELSSAVRLKVGAVVVQENRIISIGYNGMPSGWTNECEYVDTNPQTKVEQLVTKDEVIHAEANAISKLARDGERAAGATMFCTHAPCIQCAKIIYGAGINTFYYRSQYRDNDGLEFLKKFNIQVEPC
jgi:dCMP deaminase